MLILYHLRKNAMYVVVFNDITSNCLNSNLGNGWSNQGDSFLKLDFCEHFSIVLNEISTIIFEI